MKKGLFTKTVLATFISMTLIGTASAELVYRHPIDGAKASSGGIYGGGSNGGGGSDTGAETGTDTENEEEEGQEEYQYTAWEQYAIDSNLIPYSLDQENPENNSFNWDTVVYMSDRTDSLPAFPSETYPFEEISGWGQVWLENAGISSLNGFKVAKKVDTLDLRGNNITNLNALSTLRDFYALLISNNPNLTDISALNNVSNVSSSSEFMIDEDFSSRSGAVGLDETSYLCVEGFDKIFGSSSQAIKDDLCGLGSI